MHPHHRPSEADKIPEPIPGFIVGGPNSDREDSKERSRPGVEYASRMAAKSYTDQLGSFASNEVAINWNAPLVYVLGLLQANMSTSAPSSGK